jgi:hypothetical protein
MATAWLCLRHHTGIYDKETVEAEGCAPLRIHSHQTCVAVCCAVPACTRLYTISRCPKLKVLDFKKVKQKVRHMEYVLVCLIVLAVLAVAM